MTRRCSALDVVGDLRVERVIMVNGVPLVGDGGVLGVSLFEELSVDDRNGEIAGSGGVETRSDAKKRLDYLKQDQEMLMIKIFSERKKAGKSNSHWRWSWWSQIYKRAAMPIKGPPSRLRSLFVFVWGRLYLSRGNLLEDDNENLKRSERFRSEYVIEMKKNDDHIYRGILESAYTTVSMPVPLGYHNPKCVVPLMYQKIRLTASRREVLGASWKRAQRQTLNMISNLLAVRIAPLNLSFSLCMARAVRDQGGISQMFNEDFHTCMFACFLSQEEPKRVHQALKDPSWIEAMQKELLQFKMQKVWILVDLPYEKRAIEKAGEEVDQSYMLFPVWSVGSTNPQNNAEDAAFDGKEHDFYVKKPESKVILSLSSCAQSKEQDDKTKKEAKGKSPIESVTGYRDLNAEFEDCSENSSIELNAASTGPTWLFDIDNLSRTINYQPVHARNQTNSGVGFQDNFDVEKAGEEVDQSYMLFPVWSAGPTNPQNNDIDATFDGKEHDFDAMKPESVVILSLSNSTQSKEQDDKTKKEAKGKSPVESVTGYRDLNAEFQIALKTAVMSTAGPSNDAISLTYRKTSDIDASQLPDDLDMPELEDIIYSDDEDVVGAEADFNNLESSIPVSPIPTIRIYKDHPVAQIIGDLSSTTQTRSMTRAVKDQARIEAIRLFLAYASFMGFMMYQMDVKSAFLYGTIQEEVYVCQPPGFEDPNHFDKVKQKKDGVFISQDKYVAEILRKFGLTKGKSASTPIDIDKPLLKDPDGEDVDVHTYRSMIGSLMYLTSSRPDIMFAVCAYERFQVTPKSSHLHAVKRIFRYLKGKPHLGLWYLKDSPFDLVAYSDSDYASANLDKKYTTGGCQFLRCILISWQYKKLTVVATSSIEAEYVAAASCCAQVLWI
nr:hypothetical protein [Tanacetum cinerariifolium]